MIGIIYKTVKPSHLKNYISYITNYKFILESKITELNQNQNSKQLDPPGAVWKLYLGNKWIANLTQLFTRALQKRFSKSIRKLLRKQSS